MAFKSILKTEKDFLKCRYVYCEKNQSGWVKGMVYELLSISSYGLINGNSKPVFSVTFKQSNDLITQACADEYGGDFIFTPFFTSKQEYMKETDY